LKTLIKFEIQSLKSDYIDEVLEIHLSAFSGYLNTKIGKAYLRKLFHWFINSDKSVALCATNKSGKVIGYVIGATIDYGPVLQKYLMQTAVLGIFTHFWVLLDPHFLRMVLMRLGFKRRLIVAGPILIYPAISLVGIGVSPTYSRLGVGKALLVEFEKTAKRLGFNSLCLSVYPDNIAARGLYEKTGWQPGPIPKDTSETMYYIKK
jgi:ribosomal protein S18 acetylase RimI-like enzyme